MGELKFFYVGRDGEVITQPVRNASCERKATAGMCAAKYRGNTDCTYCPAWYEAYKAEREAVIEQEREMRKRHRTKRLAAKEILRKRKERHDFVCSGLAVAAGAALVCLAMLPGGEAFELICWPVYIGAVVILAGYLAAYIYANGERYHRKKERERLQRLLRRAEP